VRRKKVSEAEVNLRRSLALMEKGHGLRHGDVAAALNNLAVALHEQKKFTEAEAMLLRALDIYRTEVPAGDTRIADAKFNLAELFISQKRFVEAESLLKEAVTIRTSSYHPIADDDAFTYERYAFVLKRLGRTAEADTAAARARSMRLELQYTFRP
jgi:tetratricopeptide (TPR) repeat protein